MFESVLVANRGEIAVRVIRTLRRLGVRSIAVYSDADAEARHVRVADEAMRIGPPPAVESYLDGAAVIDAARRAGAEAIHPGYGFLAENAEFARACAAAGLVFVGPPAEAIEAMGDKIRAKQMALAAGVPVVPGRSEPGMSDSDLLAAAADIGFPVLVKPSAGGGGKGMRLVHEADEMGDALLSARREARNSFGDDTLFLERWVPSPRHIEIQVFADRRGNYVHLGERECSIQRRHQKIIEESPSPLLGDAQRESIGEDALRVARACEYVGAGTVEFIVPADDANTHYFLEMNTRLQVEHPVTELVCGVDLVEWQLLVATGAPLPRSNVERRGHAIEARVYAEDAARGFLPTGGRVLAYEEPTGEGVRVDSGVDRGAVVSALYDPMLAKVISSGETRAEAIDRLRGALERTVLDGVRTNVAYLSYLLHDPDVLAGRLDTELAERLLAGFGDEVEVDLVAAAAAGLVCELTDKWAGDPWGRADGWRLSGHAWTVRSLEFDHEQRFDVAWRGTPRSLELRVDGAPPSAVRAWWDGHILGVAGAAGERRYRYLIDGMERLLGWRGSFWRFRLVSDHEMGATRRGQRGDQTVRSPMPGSVVSVSASLGDSVEAGEVLLVVEAMKMEHSVVSPIDGVVVSIRVAPGDRVEMDEELAVIEAPVVEESERKEER